jgi:hypothetical protein
VVRIEGGGAGIRSRAGSALKGKTMMFEEKNRIPRSRRHPMKVAIVMIVIVTIVTACGRRKERAAFDPEPSKPQPTRFHPPLPPTAFHVEWTPVQLAQLPAGGNTVVSVTFKNTSDTTWPDPAMADPAGKSGSYAVRLSYSWKEKVPGAKIVGSGERVNLTKPLAPGESTTLPIGVRAPAKPGQYELIFDLVQELCCWFSSYDADPLTVPVEVGPAGAAATQTSTR